MPLSLNPRAGAAASSSLSLSLSLSSMKSRVGLGFELVLGFVGCPWKGRNDVILVQQSVVRWLLSWLQRSNQHRATASPR